jgi:hypothetical protein
VSDAAHCGSESSLFTTAVTYFNVATVSNQVIGKSVPLSAIWSEYRYLCSNTPYNSSHCRQLPLARRGPITWVVKFTIHYADVSGQNKMGPVIIMSALNATLPTKMCFSLKTGHCANQLSSQQRIYKNTRYSVL